ncbi:MAG TPA: hypothetical protein VJS69_04320 [Candidatus Krumholzibacteria bacterium]|nr:hypothetical protein [Candidatus Krumholzibacteria bacterium]
MRRSVPGWALTSLDRELLSRARKTSIIVGCVMAAPVGTYFGWMAMAAWVAGLAWSLANLAVISSVVRGVVTTKTRDVHAIGLALAVKFPALYAIAVAMFLVLKLPALWWMAGFTWPFAVILLKSAGRAYLRLDETH